MVGIDLVGDAAHIAIQGMTRSGKSQLTYNLLGRVASVAFVRVVGLDPSSLLLAPFAERGDIVALGGVDTSQAVEVLRGVKLISDQRIASMLDRRIDKFVEFSEEHPLVLLVLEEYPGLLEAAEDDDAATGRKPGERMEPQIRRLVRQLVAQSAKAGVRVLLMAQRAEAGILGGASRSNFGTRVTLRVDNPDSVRMLHPSADAALCERVATFAPGVAVLDRPGYRREIIRGPVTEYGDYYSRVMRGRLRMIRA